MAARSAEVAASWEVSRQTLHAWLARYEDGGWRRWRIARPAAVLPAPDGQRLPGRPSGNPSGGPSSTRTSPSTTARVTFSRAAPGRWRRESGAKLENLYRHDDCAQRRGPAPPSVSSRRPTPGHTTTPPSAELPGPSGTSSTPSTAPRPPRTVRSSHNSGPWSQPLDPLPPGSSRSGGLRGLHVVVGAGRSRPHGPGLTAPRGAVSGTCRTHDGDGWDLTRGFA